MPRRVKPAPGLLLTFFLIGCGASGTQSPSAVPTPTPSPTRTPGPAGGTPFPSRIVGDSRDLPARVYSTVSTGEGPDMVADRDEWVDRLRSRKYPRLHVQTATYAGIEHNLSSGPAFREGLSELF